MNELHPDAGWSDARVELTKKLWKDGVSAASISKQLGGVSRNAVIGKLHRLGLSGRATPSRPRVAAATAQTPRRDPKPKAKLSLPPRIVAQPIRSRDETPGTATILTLGPHMCKWPIGDPALPGFTVCGRRADDGSYCHEHAQVAYQPATTKKATANELARSLRRYL